MYTLNILPFNLDIILKKLKKEKNQEFQCFLYNIVDISAITLGM